MLPQKLTNDTAEFSFRQMALARMKIQDNDTSELQGDQQSQYVPKGIPTYDAIRKATSNSRTQGHQKNFTSINFQTKCALSPHTEKRLEETLQKSMHQKNARSFQPTYTGFLSEQMSP